MQKQPEFEDAKEEFAEPLGCTEWRRIRKGTRPVLVIRYLFQICRMLNEYPCLLDSLEVLVVRILDTYVIILV